MSGGRVLPLSLTALPGATLHCVTVAQDKILVGGSVPAQGKTAVFGSIVLDSLWSAESSAAAAGDDEID